ncbi:uncharacterized protein [Rutidosis leptorrhynchoides]|uniref:uncharacterized protein n=1 Tax=Rutidosis leptorrhynchoides TaxID=125765 RepID=UPI003A99DD93
MNDFFGELLSDCVKCYSTPILGVLAVFCWTLGDFICLNVVESYMGNPGPPGVGGVFRNSSGNWLCGFLGVIETHFNLMAELLALFHGLKLAWDLKYRQLTAFTDSMDALHTLKLNNRRHHSYVAFICDIRCLLNRE